VTPQLDLRDVSKRFGGVLANDRVSVHVGRGEIVGLIGPNGSGKTTLFNSIVGHQAIDSGTVRFEGQEITGLRMQTVARMGLIRTFQHTRSYHGMACIENVQISLPHRHLRLQSLVWPLPVKITRQALALLDLVGLRDQKDALAGDLSFGQQRLLELAMALMNEPKLLLLDEPTAGINPTVINALIERIRDVNRKFGITMFVIEHNMPMIMGLADRIYCLNRGRVLAEGPPKEIQRDPRVIDAYLGAR
jgi:branched-chain amino acid transport system ATP-binding protein